LAGRCGAVKSTVNVDVLVDLHVYVRGMLVGAGLGSSSNSLLESVTVNGFVCPFGWLEHVC
jgi:hypothetical protein